MKVILTEKEMLDMFLQDMTGYGCGYDILAQDVPRLVEKLIEANEKKRGAITCTKDENGCIVAVTRTNNEGQILEVIAEGKSFEEIKREICI